MEAAIHAARDLFEDSEVEAMLQIDARNAFNCLNRKTSLFNIQFIWPKISSYLLNTYRSSARLILGSGHEILSREGTTHGENLASAFYAVSVRLIITTLNDINCHQEWFLHQRTK